LGWSKFGFSQQGDLDCGGASTMGELVKDQVHMMSKELGNTTGDHEAMALKQPPTVIAPSLLVHLLHLISKHYRLQLHDYKNEA
jgi:hypothetical protein